MYISEEKKELIELIETIIENKQKTINKIEKQIKELKNFKTWTEKQTSDKIYCTAEEFVG